MRSFLMSELEALWKAKSKELSSVYFLAHYVLTEESREARKMLGVTVSELSQLRSRARILKMEMNR